MSEHFCSKSEVIQDMKKDIDTLKQDSREIIRLTTLLEQQMEQSKEQGKSIRQLSETLIRVADFISEQKETLKKMNEKIESNDSKLDELDRKVVTQSHDQQQSLSINIMDWLKKAIPYVVGFGLFYLLQHADKIIALFK